MNKIKIVHLIDSLGPGGAQDILRHLTTKSSDEFSHHIVVLRKCGSYYENQLRQAGIGLVYLTDHGILGSLVRLPSIMLRLRKLLITSQFDILHLHLQASMLVGCIASMGINIRRVLTIYAWQAQLPNWVYPCIRLLTPALDKVAWVDKTEIAWLPNDRFIKIFPGADLSIDFQSGRGDLKKEFHLKDDGPYLFSVARFHPDKGHADAIRAYAEIRKYIPSTTLFVIGEGPEEEKKRLLQLSADIGGQGVIFTGYRPDLHRFYGLGGFFLRTSVNECGNMSTILASCAGVITIGYDVSRVLPSHMEMIQNKINGRIVPFKDYRQMADEVVRIWNTPSEYAKYSLEAKKYAHSHWDIQKSMLEPIQSAYRAIAKAGRR